MMHPQAALGTVTAVTHPDPVRAQGTAERSVWPR
jgi:hypothetical protein